MKTNNVQVYHHYHHIVYNYKFISRFFIGIFLLSTTYGFLSAWDEKSHGALSRSFKTSTNGMLQSYVNILNLLVSFFGWKRGFLWFGHLHLGWGSLIFFGIPVLATLALIFVLKREKIAIPIIMLFYLWHSGVSFAINHYKSYYLGYILLILFSPWIVTALRNKFVTFWSYRASRKINCMDINSGLTGMLKKHF